MFVSWICMFTGWKDEGFLPLGYGVNDRDKYDKGSPCGSWGLYILQWKNKKFRKIPITWGSKEVRARDIWILSNETSRYWKKNTQRVSTTRSDLSPSPDDEPHWLVRNASTLFIVMWLLPKYFFIIYRWITKAKNL